MKNSKVVKTSLLIKATLMIATLSLSSAWAQNGYSPLRDRDFLTLTGGLALITGASLNALRLIEQDYNRGAVMDSLEHSTDARVRDILAGKVIRVENPILFETEADVRAFRTPELPGTIGEMGAWARRENIAFGERAPRNTNRTRGAMAVGAALAVGSLAPDRYTWDVVDSLMEDVSDAVK